MNSDETNPEITAGLKLAEPVLLVVILTLVDFIITIKLHAIFPHQSSMIPPEIGFFWNNYLFNLAVLIQSLIFYAVATRYRRPDAEGQSGGP